MSLSESRSAVVLELAEEFLERYRQGERPSLKEYIERHPDLAAEIKDVFSAMALMENVALADESVAGTSREAGSASAETTPVQLGDYRILREVGRGGMGIVYEAEQISLGRHVALKVLPRKVLLEAAQKRRFEREAKAAARLHHTNIVPVFGVGEHEGMPYYVMQLIQGLGLDQVLEELKRLQSTGEPPVSPLPMARGAVLAGDVARTLLTGAFADAERDCLGVLGEGTLGAPRPCRAPETSSDTSNSSDSSALPVSSVNLPRGGGKSKKTSFCQSVARIGIQVADALAYAHKQGIQHRDIKPSNLLLDRRGTVWVTDFGLARADNEDHLTQTDDIVGTLRYLPPEAFEGQMDVRGDLYSLGLTLYELLALRPAFAERERHKLIKQVTTTEPARLDKLNRTIPRDLATIVHKAIDREPARRYPNAAELAADLQRFLDDEPIHARQVSARERCWRWCRRNPVVAGLLTAVFVLLVAVAALSSAAAFHFAAAREQEEKLRRVADAARQRLEEAHQREVIQHQQTEAARAESERQKQRAQENFRQARQAVDDYLTRVSENRLLRVPGMQPLRKELLQSALHYYQGFLKQRGQDAALNKDLAAAYLRLATITAEIDSPQQALTLCAKGQEILEDLQRQDPKSKEIRLDLVACRQTAGNLQRRLEQLDAALQSCQQAYRILLEVSPQDANSKGRVFRVSGAFADGIPLHSSEDPEILGLFFSILNDTGAVYRQMGELGAALYRYDQALLIQESLVRDHPQHPRIVSFQHGLARQWNRLGSLQGEMGMYADAQACHQKAQAILEHLLGEHPRHDNAADFQRELAASQESDGDILAKTGQLDAALKTYESALPLRQRLARQNPAVTDYQNDLARNYFQRSMLDLRANRPTAALSALQQAIEYQRGLVETTPGINSYVRTLSRQFGRLGAVQQQLHQSAAAEQSYRAARKLLEELPPTRAGDWYELALWRAACRDADSALEALRQAIQAGYHDLDRLDKDAELAPLRSRPEFQKLLEEVRRRTKTLHWTEDFEAARAQAAKDNKDLFLWFGGSDWAPLDMIQRKTRFERAGFIDYATKHFVMVDLDSPIYKPKPKNYAKTQHLIRKWQINGYPLGVLTDARGRPYGILSTDRKGTRSLEQLVAELEKKRQVRVRRDELLAQAAASKGLKKAKLLDRALSTVPSLFLMSYRDVMQEILALDRDNQAELRSKYLSRAAPRRGQATPTSLGALHWKAGQLAEAIRWWQRSIAGQEAALKKDEDNPLLKGRLAALHRRIATAYAEVGLWEEAAAALEIAFDLQPDFANGPTWFGRAGLALQLGKPDRFRRVCQDFLELPSSSDHAHFIARLNMLAPAAYADATLAVTASRQKWKNITEHWNRFVSGTAHYRAGHYPEAERLFHESMAPSLKPRYLSHRWFWLALVCQRQGKAEEAKQWLRKGLLWMEQGRVEQEPDGGPSNPHWNQTLELQLLRREAEMLVSGAASPEPMDLVLTRALAYVRLEQPNKAAADLAAMDHFKPDTPKHCKARGQIYAAFGQTEKAASDFARALELSGTAGAALRREIYAELDRRDQLLTQVVALRPTDSELAAFRRARNANARDSGPAGIVIPGNLLSNGSLEEGYEPYGTKTVGYRKYQTGSTEIPGWTVCRGSVDVGGLPWYSASQGSRCLDLDGDEPGGIRQTVATKAGQQYRLVFDLAGNPYVRQAAVKKLRVQAAGQSADFAFDTTGRGAAGVGWVGKQWQFTAATARTTVEFLSLDSKGSTGPLVDNIALVPVSGEEKKK